MAANPALEKLQADKLRAEIAKLKSEKAYIDMQAESYRDELDDDETEPLNQRILPFLGAVNEKNVSGAMYHLTKMSRRSKDPITVWFNSPGGYVVDGLALYDFIVGIREGGVEVNTVALGEAASMAGVLLQAGTKRYVGSNAHVLIHEVAGGMVGKVSELKDEMAYTERLQKRLLAILAERSTLTAAQIARRWKKTDWWLNAEECVDLGFADGVYRS